MSKAVEIIDGVLFVHTRHYDDVNRVIICNQKRPYRVFSDDVKKEWSRPHGEWHTKSNPNYSPFDSTNEVIYMCSQCAYSSGERITATWNFCPNCGSDMRKEGVENGDGKEV